MSGPIVRTGTTPEYWKGWDKVFGKKGAAKKAVAAPAAAKPAVAAKKKKS